MLENLKIRPDYVIGPCGEPLTVESLPPVDTRRWVARRKAQVVAAVAGGLLGIDEACRRYSLTIEELTSWQRAFNRNGMQGLRITHLKEYREEEAHAAAEPCLSTQAMECLPHADSCRAKPEEQLLLT